MSNDLGLTYVDLQGRHHDLNALSATTSPTTDQVDTIVDREAKIAIEFADGEGIASSYITDTTSGAYALLVDIVVNRALAKVINGRERRKTDFGDWCDSLAVAAKAELIERKSEWGSSRPTDPATAPGIHTSHRTRDAKIAAARTGASARLYRMMAKGER